MRIIGVLDIRGGLAVRGVGGRRDEYRPIGDPLTLARAWKDGFGIEELYVADLDAIRTGTPDTPAYEALAGEGLNLLVDCGVRTSGPLGPWLVVAGLETLAGPQWLNEGVIFSLDLNAGRPMAGPGWPEGPKDIVGEAVRRGVRTLIVLDLARVGTGMGTGTEMLLAWMRAESPDLEILAGGGIAGRGDLERLQRLGVDGVLVGSALHDGRLGRHDLSGW